ncbi:MAG: glutathione S-transferase C-terminal domain-containing protein [Stagnimonas sp.]|nr:glutathione S-transferase C-terminal domain-containing protein [Stagnimonas sp.]
MSRAQDWLIWGSELSPYSLKLALCCRHARLPHRLLPTQGSWAENIRINLRVERLKRGGLPLTWPQRTQDDEYPLVPYLFGPQGENLYDSSAIAEWLDQRLPDAEKLIPSEPLAGFVARLIDDYADEFLLYVVHHQRWVVSATDNDAGQRLAHEFRSLVGPLRPLMARHFSARQTRRLPYLFSVAPAGFQIAGLHPNRQPPERKGFPPTHALLERAHTRLVDLLDVLLATRPYVLGDRFTLADAALYGQLGMNLADPSTAKALQARSPRLHQWLLALHSGIPRVVADGALRIDDALKPLLAEIARIHLPLMQQNAAAHARFQQQGQRRFNEAAFNAGQALYDSVLDGVPYCSVAKSFQARSWRDCRTRWQQLPSSTRDQVAALMPGSDALS